MKRIDFRGMAAIMMALALGTGAVAAQAGIPEKEITNEEGRQVMLPEVNVMPYEGVGPVVMGSVSYVNLPHRMRHFLDKHCDGAAVVRCDKVYTSGEYEIAFADGIEMAFSKNGDLVDITAPRGYSLSSSLVKAILPKHTFKALKKSNLDVHVGAIVHDGYGYHVNLNGDKAGGEVLFNNAGDYIASYQ